MPYRCQNRYQYNPRSTGSRSYSRLQRQYQPPQRSCTCPPLALSGMTRPRRAFGHLVGHRRLPLPYLTMTAMGPTRLEVGGINKDGQALFQESHIIMAIDVDAGDMLSGVLLSVSLPSVNEGSIYVAEVLCTTKALTVGTTAHMPQTLPYHAGSSTRIPTRLPQVGSTFSCKRFIAKKATTRTMYFWSHVTADVGDLGRPVRT